MGSKPQNLIDIQKEDPYSEYNLHRVFLYSYEWKIGNIYMINSSSKPIVSPLFSVSPCKNLDLKLTLTSSGYERVKIEARLIKECRITAEMRLREANCPLESKPKIHMLGLEFFDNSGNIISSYECLPYEFKLINTSVIYAWTTEENVSRVIQNDYLTVRAKLSMRFYENSAENDPSDIDNSTGDLMNDMKNFYQNRNYSPDILIKIESEYMPCHKSIIYSQYPSFAKLAKNGNYSVSNKKTASPIKLPCNINSIISKNCEILNFKNENVEILLSVLYFMYTKQMRASLTIDYFAVYEFAKKYGVRDLSMLLMPCKITVLSNIEVKKLNYIWYVENFSSLKNEDSSPIHSPKFKTEIGNKVFTWKVMTCFDSNYAIFNLKRMDESKSDVQTLVKFGIYNAYGSVYEEKEFSFLYPPDATNNCFRFIEPESHFEIVPDMLYNDTLTVYCDLIVSCGELSSDIKDCYPSANPNINLVYWVHNFQRLFESQSFSDIILIVEEKQFRVHKAILAARSPVFARMFESDMEEKRSGCARIKDTTSEVMKQALLYIYTSKVGNLTMTRAPELYSVADKYEIMGLKSECSDFMVQNLDSESACEILIIADFHNDAKLKEAAKSIICRNASLVLLSAHGIELISNHTSLAHDILKTLSDKFCSLPPQDAVFTSNSKVEPSVEGDNDALTDFKNKYCDFVDQNLDLENPCEILIVANMHDDKDLKIIAKNVICRNAAEAFLTPGGTELISYHSLLAHDILERLSSAYCSFLTDI